MLSTEPEPEASTRSTTKPEAARCSVAHQSGTSPAAAGAPVGVLPEPTAPSCATTPTTGAASTSESTTFPASSLAAGAFDFAHQGAGGHAHRRTSGPATGRSDRQTARGAALGTLQCTSGWWISGRRPLQPASAPAAAAAAAAAAVPEAADASAVQYAASACAAQVSPADQADEEQPFR